MLYQYGRQGFHPHPRIKFGAGSSPLPEGTERGMYSQTVIPAKAGIQGLGASFDEFRTNDLSVYIPLSALRERGHPIPQLGTDQVDTGSHPRLDLT